MISEIDLKDWDFDKLFEEAYKEQDTRSYLHTFLTEMEKLQKRGQRQVAALFKPFKATA